MLLLELSRFLRLSRTCSLFPGLSIPRKFQNKIPGLSRFCRTCTNLIENLSKKYVLTFKCLPSNLAASNGRHIISNKYACPENKTRWIKNLSILDKLFNSVMIPFWLRTGKVIFTCNYTISFMGKVFVSNYFQFTNNTWRIIITGNLVLTTGLKM